MPGSGKAQRGGPLLAQVVSSSSTTATQEALAGLVKRVTFHNAENGFCVLRARARGHRDVVTIVGHAAVISIGEWITATGEWVNDRTHGQQFRARFLKTVGTLKQEQSEPQGQLVRLSPARQVLSAACALPAASIIGLTLSSAPPPSHGMTVPEM